MFQECWGKRQHSWRLPFSMFVCVRLLVRVEITFEEACTWLLFLLCKCKSLRRQHPCRTRTTYDVLTDCMHIVLHTHCVWPGRLVRQTLNQQQQLRRLVCRENFLVHFVPSTSHLLDARQNSKIMNDNIFVHALCDCNIKRRNTHMK